MIRTSMMAHWKTKMIYLHTSKLSSMRAKMSRISTISLKNKREIGKNAKLSRKMKTPALHIWLFQLPRWLLVRSIKLQNKLKRLWNPQLTLIYMSIHLSIMIPESQSNSWWQPQTRKLIKGQEISTLSQLTYRKTPTYGPTPEEISHNLDRQLKLVTLRLTAWICKRKVCCCIM